MSALDEMFSQCRPDLRPYVVAAQTPATMQFVRPEARWFPIGEGSLRHWREEYDAGRVELTHHRVDGGFLLLAIPRRRRVERGQHARLGAFKPLNGPGGR